MSYKGIICSYRLGLLKKLLTRLFKLYLMLKVKTRRSKSVTTKKEQNLRERETAKENWHINLRIGLSIKKGDKEDKVEMLEKILNILGEEGLAKDFDNLI